MGRGGQNKSSVLTCAPKWEWGTLREERDTQLKSPCGEGLAVPRADVLVSGRGPESEKGTRRTEEEEPVLRRRGSRGRPTAVGQHVV